MKQKTVENRRTCSEAAGKVRGEAGRTKNKEVQVGSRNRCGSLLGGTEKGAFKGI